MTSLAHEAITYPFTNFLTTSVSPLRIFKKYMPTGRFALSPPLYGKIFFSKVPGSILRTRKSAGLGRR